jgi:peroxiredoxin
MKLFALLVFAASLAAQAPRKAPSFTLPDSNRTMHDLTDHRGKVVVLEVMRTDCPHCGSFGKVLEQVNKQYGKNVQVFSVVTPPDSPETVGKFAAAHKSTYPILFDCGQATFAYVLSGQVSLPRVWIIDRNGMIAKDVSYTDQTKDFFEKRGIFTEIDKTLAKK